MANVHVNTEQPDPGQLNPQQVGPGQLKTQQTDPAQLNPLQSDPDQRIQSLVTPGFLVTSLATVLFLSAYYLLTPVLTLRMDGLGYTNTTIGAVMAAFSVSSLIVRPSAGWFIDRHGPRVWMLGSAGAFLAAPVIYIGFGGTVPLAVAQVISGITVGAFTVASTALIALTVPGRRTAHAISWFSITFISAKGLAPALGAWLAPRWAFPWIVVLAAAMALAGLLILLAFRAPTAREVAATGGAQEAPIGRHVLLASAVLFSITVTFGSITTFLPILGQERNLPGYGYFFIFETIAVMFIRLVGGPLADRVGGKRIISAALVVVTASVLLFSFVTTLPALIAIALLYGLGYGAAYPALTAAVLERTRPEDKGKALGLFTTTFDLGVAAGSLLGGTSEFLSFAGVYLISALFPLIGIAVTAALYRGATAVDAPRVGRE